MNSLTALQKKKKNNKKQKQQQYEILTKTLWLQDTIVQNSLVSHPQMIYTPIWNSVLVHQRKKNFFTFPQIDT